MFNSSLGGGGGGGGGEFKNSIFFFQKSNYCISILVYLHVFFFLSFVCFVSQMSEFDALLASRRSF